MLQKNVLLKINLQIACEPVCSGSSELQRAVAEYIPVHAVTVEIVR
jgi:hypothetical protein